MDENSAVGGTTPATQTAPRRARWPLALAALLGALVGAGLLAVVLWPDDDPADERGATPTTGEVTTTGSPATEPPTTAATAPPTTLPPLSVDSPVLITGIGSIRAGMTVEEASRGGGVDLVEEAGAAFPDCTFVVPAGGPEGISFMVTGGTIGRVDVDAPGVRTRSGVGIGSTEQQVMATYPGRITVSPHLYTDGNYLTFVPRDAADAGFRIVFETDGSAVTRFRAGRVPDVEAVEGCA